MLQDRKALGCIIKRGVECSLKLDNAIVHIDFF